MQLKIKGTVKVKYTPVRIWFIAIGRSHTDTYQINETYPIVAANTLLWSTGGVQVFLNSGKVVVTFMGQTLWSKSVALSKTVKIENVRGVTADLVVTLDDEPNRSWSGETIPIVEPPKGG